MLSYNIYFFHAKIYLNMQKYNASVGKPLSDLPIFATEGLKNAVENVLKEKGSASDHALVSRALTNLPFNTLNYSQRNELLDIFQKLNITADKPQTYNIWRGEMDKKIEQLRESILHAEDRGPIMAIESLGGRTKTRSKARSKSRAKAKPRAKPRAKSRAKSRAKPRIKRPAL